MPIDKRRDSKLIAVIVADIVGGDGDTQESRASVRPGLERINRLFFPALAAAFAMAGEARIAGALADPAQAPLCISVLRETLAPTQVRVGVGIGTVQQSPGGANRDAYSVARRALQLAARDASLTRYLGTGEAGDVLLGALCRLVDPLIRARTRKQWEAIAAYRELGHQRDVAQKLGVTRQSVGDRLTAGHRRAVEEADAAIATYLSYIRRQRYVH
jgi:hypothetical protein